MKIILIHVGWNHHNDILIFHLFVFHAHCPVHQNHQQYGLVLEIDALFCAEPFIMYIVDHLFLGQVKILAWRLAKKEICCERHVCPYI